MTISLDAEGPVADARDLGFLLHKHPNRVQQFSTAGGTAHVMYPQADDARTTAALLLDLNVTDEFVTDRPYVAGSHLAVAIGSVYRTAMIGRCDARPDLASQDLPLTIKLPAVPCRGGIDQVKRMFEPVGWTVEVAEVPLDPELPEWGASRYLNLTLTGSVRLSQALSHLYVLLPVLDNSKHYWVSSDEAEKLVRRGGDWLATHPERDFIVRRYLAHRKSFVNAAQERLDALDDRPVPDEVDDLDAEAAEDAEPTVPLVVHRHHAVCQAVQDVGAHTVLDLGCGPGTLLRKLLRDSAITELVGVDVSARDLEIAARRLHLDRQDRRSERVTLLHSSLTYLDDRLKGFDVAILMEVIEHLDLDRLPALERAVFGHAHPGAVIVTTPNGEYNLRYENLPAGQFRHPDHRFEWTRAEFAAWAERVSASYGYQVEIRPVGEEDPEVGPSTQLALFTRTSVPKATSITTAEEAGDE